MKREPVLALQEVSFAYAGGGKALQSVSLNIYEGERIAVLGANGAGKSTLFLNMNGVLFPQQGRLCYRGHIITRKNVNVLRRGVGIIFQDADSQMIAPSVRAEISFGPMNLKLSRMEVESRVAAAVSFMNLQGYEDRPPHTLSGGEKKRVSIADIIAMEPEVFLFDEPQASLDPLHVRQLEQVLDLLSGKGKTLIVGTHDVDFAWRWADRVLVMQEGTVRADGPPPAVFSEEALCEDANLEQPMLYQLTKLLEERNLLKEKGRIPRTVKELDTLLGDGQYLTERKERP